MGKPEKLPEHMIELTGTPEEIEAMLGVASKVERKIFRKHRVDPGTCILWYRGEKADNDLVAAIKRKAGLIKDKGQPAASKKVVNEHVEAN